MVAEKAKRNKRSKHGMRRSLSDFMTEEQIQTELETKIQMNLKRFPGKKILARSNEEKDEGDPLPWIEPDEDRIRQLTHHAKTEHELTYRHMEPVDKKTGKYNCNTLTDKWYEWFLKTPASISAFTNPSQSYQDTSLLGGRNAFLFRDKNTLVYFVAASPFQNPDIRTITITEKAPLLVPVYNMSASTEDHPSLSADELKSLIIEDLSGIIQLAAWFDRTPIQGCCVVRQRRLEITDIPKDNVVGIPEDRLFRANNSVQTYHGGYWLLIREEILTPGDHLLEFSTYSRNYEMDSKLIINVLR
jgi:hypothetical protein